MAKLIIVFRNFANGLKMSFGATTRLLEAKLLYLTVCCDDEGGNAL